MTNGPLTDRGESRWSRFKGWLLDETCYAFGWPRPPGWVRQFEDAIKAAEAKKRLDAPKERK